MQKPNALDWIVLLLVVIGGLNWGLVGIFDFDLVATFFGEMSTVSRIVYALVGVSAIYLLIVFPTKSKKGTMSPQ
jgi:uncharacterized membrane protein YuzA (DUF378 family)